MASDQLDNYILKHMDEGDPNEQTKLNLQSERLHSLKQIELEKRLIFLPIGIKFTFFF